MKFDIKNVIIIVLTLLVIWLLFPRMSFADEMAPSPAPAPSGNAQCLSQLFKISDLCPSDHPHTGDITADGQKYCCE